MVWCSVLLYKILLWILFADYGPGYNLRWWWIDVWLLSPPLPIWTYPYPRNWREITCSLRLQWQTSCLPESCGKHACKCKKLKLSEIIFSPSVQRLGANLECRIACKYSIICTHGSQECVYVFAETPVAFGYTIENRNCVGRNFQLCP